MTYQWCFFFLLCLRLIDLEHIFDGIVFSNIDESQLFLTIVTAHGKCEAIFEADIRALNAANTNVTLVHKLRTASIVFPYFDRTVGGRCGQHAVVRMIHNNATNFFVMCVQRPYGRTFLPNIAVVYFASVGRREIMI